MNRGVTQILNVHVAFVVLVFAVVSIFYYRELVSTKLGKTMLVSISIYYFLRPVNQTVFFGARGSISAIIIAGCIVGGALYFVPLIIPSK